MKPHLDQAQLAACRTDDERLLLGLDALQAELSKDALARANEPGRWKVLTAAGPSSARRRAWHCAYCERHVSIGPDRSVCPNCGAAEEHDGARTNKRLLRTSSTGPG